MLIFKSIIDILPYANAIEIWEPTMAHLSVSATQLIDEIWSLEAIQHGDAGLINSANPPGFCRYQLFCAGRIIVLIIIKTIGLITHATFSIF